MSNIRITRKLKLEEMRKARNLEKKNVKTMSRIQPKVESLSILNPLSLSNFSNQLGVTTGQLIRNFPQNFGPDTKLNELISVQVMKNICSYLKVQTILDEEELLDVYPNLTENDENAKPRPPVVTIMGHVDHGKTSLLDQLRKTNQVSKEHGGITQHLGAFELKISQEETITFVDTPGHAAFSSMRAAGANVTDIVILVIAVDDGVKQQTIEALNQAKKANVKIIIALNKIDKMKSDSMKKKIENDLLVHDIILESNGGDTPLVEISALKGIGMRELLDEILIQAEFLNLRALQECNTEAIVLETKVDSGLGVRVSVIVKRGILKPGQWFVCGNTYGRIKSLIDSNKNQLDQVFPSQAIEIIGVEGIPKSSDYLIQVDDEETAKEIMKSREKKKKLKEMNEQVSENVNIKSNTKTKSIEPVEEKYEEKKENELLVIVKVDVQGTLDAIHKVLQSFPKKEVYVKLIRSGVGMISNADVQIAKNTKSLLIGMNTKANHTTKSLAKNYNVDIKEFNVIYHFIDFLKENLLSMAPAKFEETILGTALVDTSFDIKNEKKLVKVAGSVVKMGKATTEASFCNVLRWKKKIFENLKVESIFRFKDSVKQVPEGQECGIHIQDYDDIQKGDVIEFVKKEKLKKTFEELI